MTKALPVIILAGALTVNLCALDTHPTPAKTPLLQYESLSKPLYPPADATVKVNADGSFIAFAIGEGTYDFTTPDEIASAKQEAVLRAKKALSDVIGGMLAPASEQQQAKEKAAQSPQLSPTARQHLSDAIAAGGSNLVSGATVIKLDTIPGKATSGLCRAIIYLSDQTVSEARKLKSCLKPQSAKQEAKPKMTSPTSIPSPTDTQPNTHELRESSTDF